MKLFDYVRSTAAYRVRIALNFKGVDYESVPVNLLDGEQRSDAYLAQNPLGLVPALATGQDLLTQSLAIVEFLEETIPAPPLLPADADGRARQRAMAMVVACDIHPLNNLRVQQYLRERFEADDAAVGQWMATWMYTGFEALERQAGDDPFLGGPSPQLADLFLAPQFYNARRFDIPTDRFPRLEAIVGRCNALPAFARAAPP